MMSIFILLWRSVNFTDLSFWIPCFWLIFMLLFIRFLKKRCFKVYCTEFFLSSRCHCGILSEEITQRLSWFFDSENCRFFIKILNLTLKLLIDSIPDTWSWRDRWNGICHCCSWALNLAHRNADLHCLWRLHHLNLVCWFNSFHTYRLMFVNNYRVVSTPNKWLIYAVFILVLLLFLSHLVHDIKFDIFRVLLQHDLLLNLAYLPLNIMFTLLENLLGPIPYLIVYCDFGHIRVVMPAVVLIYHSLIFDLIK